MGLFHRNLFDLSRIISIVYRLYDIAHNTPVQNDCILNVNN